MDQEFVFSITSNKIVKLIVPVDLNKNDISIIQKQMELLQLQSEIASIQTDLVAVRSNKHRRKKLVKTYKNRRTLRCKLKKPIPLRR